MLLNTSVTPTLTQTIATPLTNIFTLIPLSILIGVICVILNVLRFPDEIKNEDPDWLITNIWEIIGISGLMVGFIPLSMGMAFLMTMKRWPSEYLPPDSIAWPIFALFLYLVVHLHNEWKNWVPKIYKKYGKTYSLKKDSKNVLCRLRGLFRLRDEKS